MRCPNQQIRQTFVSGPDGVIVHRIVSVGKSNDAADCLIRLVDQDSRPKSKRHASIHREMFQRVEFSVEGVGDQFIR